MKETSNHTHRMDRTTGEMASSAPEICDLPDEVLYYIFTKLNVDHVMKCVMNVCQRWRSVVAERTVFWYNVQLAIDTDRFFGHSYLGEEQVRKSDDVVKSICDVPAKPWLIFIGEKDLEKVPKLQSIQFTEGSTVIHESVDLLITVVDIISKTCKEIDNVEFFNCFGALSSQFMRFLYERYNNIKKIIFSMKPKMYRVPYDEVARFSKLNTLVSNDELFKSSDLFILASNCHHLKSLWILFCTSLKIEDLFYFIDGRINILTELGVGINLEDCILDKLKECHNLEVFFATDSRNVSDACIKSFAYQSRLKYCSLHKATFLQSTVLEIAGALRKPEMFEHLSILDLTGYSPYSRNISSSWNSWIKLNSKTEDNVDSSIFKPMRHVQVTFSNTVRSSLSEAFFSPSEKTHWMYHHC